MDLLQLQMVETPTEAKILTCDLHPLTVTRRLFPLHQPGNYLATFPSSFGKQNIRITIQHGDAVVSALNAVMDENVEEGAKGALPTPSPRHSLTLASVSPRSLEAASSPSGHFCLDPSRGPPAPPGISNLLCGGPRLLGAPTKGRKPFPVSGREGSGRENWKEPQIHGT